MLGPENHALPVMTCLGAARFVFVMRKPMELLATHIGDVYGSFSGTGGEAQSPESISEHPLLAPAAKMNAKGGRGVLRGWNPARVTLAWLPSESRMESERSAQVRR